MATACRSKAQPSSSANPPTSTRCRKFLISWIVEYDAPSNPSTPLTKIAQNSRALLSFRSKAESSSLIRDNREAFDIVQTSFGLTVLFRFSEKPHLGLAREAEADAKMPMLKAVMIQVPCTWSRALDYGAAPPTRIPH
jgi:hypothetical protein